MGFKLRTNGLNSGKLDEVMIDLDELGMMLRKEGKDTSNSYVVEVNERFGRLFYGLFEIDSGIERFSGEYGRVGDVLVTV